MNNRTFEEWIKTYSKRKFNNNNDCVLLDLNGKILHSFSNLLRCADFLGMVQFTNHQYNSGAIIKKKYRVYTIEYYKQNYNNIINLKNYSNLSKKVIEDNSKKRIIICDLYPNEEFDMFTLSNRIKKNYETIRLILKGKILKNDYNIRYKYPELRK